MAKIVRRRIDFEDEGPENGERIGDHDVRLVYADLLAERARLRRRVDALRRRLRQTNQRIAQLRAPALKSPTKPDGRKGRPGAMRREMIRALQEHAPEPLHGDEVLAHLEHAGLAPNGLRPGHTVYTTLGILANRRRVRRVGPNLWTVGAAAAGEAIADAAVRPAGQLLGETAFSDAAG